MASHQIKLPRNLDAILKRADSKVDKSSDKLKNQLAGGIFLDNKKMLFKADGQTSATTFWIYARGMDIACKDDENCWNWKTMIDEDIGGNVMVEVAELVSVSNLSVYLKFNTQDLTPKKSYKVSFVLMMKKKAEGFEGHPVKLSLVVPDASLQIQSETDLSKMPKNEWKKVDVGQFQASDDIDHLEVSLLESGCQLKKGLIVKKIVICPID